MRFESSLLGLSLPLLLAACHGPPPKAGFQADVIAVTGVGEAKARPDVVRLTLGVEAQDENASTAVDAMTARMQPVIDALKASGVAEADIQTNQISIYSETREPPPPPYYTPAPAAEPRAEARSAPASKVAAAAAVAPPPAPPRPATIYRVTNTVAVTVRQVGRLGAVLGAALAAGANQAGGIAFDVENRKPLEDQARAKAVEDAIDRGRELARLGGVKLGRLVSVGEGGGPEPMPMGGYSFKAASASAPSVVPTEEGQIAAHHEVRAVFEIDE